MWTPARISVHDDARSEGKPAPQYPTSADRVRLMLAALARELDERDAAGNNVQLRTWDVRSPLIVGSTAKPRGRPNIERRKS